MPGLFVLCGCLGDVLVVLADALVHVGVLAQGGAHHGVAPERQVFQVLGNVNRLSLKEMHMATNLAIDPDLLDRAVEVGGERTKKAAVTRALQEFIARREQRRVAALFGKLEWDDLYNYKAERSRRA